MKHKFSIDIVLDEKERCNGCLCLDISTAQIAECMYGYWSEDMQFDGELSDDEGEFIYIRPGTCIEDHEGEG